MVCAVQGGAKGEDVAGERSAMGAVQSDDDEPDELSAQPREGQHGAGLSADDDVVLHELGRDQVMARRRGEQQRRLHTMSTRGRALRRDAPLLS